MSRSAKIKKGKIGALGKGRGSKETYRSSYDIDIHLSAHLE